MAETLERNYVVPLRRGFIKTAPYKKSKKAVKTLREFISKHMKSDNVKIGKELNDLIWVHGIKNPPCKVSVTCIKDKDGKVDVNLEGIKPVKAEKVEAPKTEVKKVETKKEAKDETPSPEELKPEVKEEDVKAELMEEKAPISEKDVNRAHKNQKY